MALIGSVFKVGGKIASASSKRKGRSFLRKARKLEKVTQFERAVQQRRAFLRQARAAQAEAILGGVATGASLESSGVQGSLQSLTTQTQQALSEQRSQFRRGAQITQFQEFAKTQFEQAANIESQFEAIGQIGDAVAGG